MKTKTYNATIFIAGDYNLALGVVSNWCDEVGDCWTVSKTDYIFTDGRESGVAVGRINYPKFPSTPEDIQDRAVKLAELLKSGMNQQSCSIVFSDFTVWSGYDT